MLLKSLIETDLSVQYKKGLKIYTANKIAELIDRNSDSHINVPKIKQVLNNESEYWTESAVDIASLIHIDDKDVDKSRAKLDKGRIVVLSDGTIIDGRHRAAMLRSMNKKKINAYVPLKQT